MRRVLARGVKVTGATVHFVDDGTDTGPILLQKSVEVLPGRHAEEPAAAGDGGSGVDPSSRRPMDLIAAGRVEVVDGKAVIR